MTVQERNGKTVVVAPFVGSPAYKAGLRPGDVIVEVDDKKHRRPDHASRSPTCSRVRKARRCR